MGQFDALVTKRAHNHGMTKRKERTKTLVCGQFELKPCYSHAQIAKVMGVSAEAVRLIEMRALQKAARILEKRQIAAPTVLPDY